MLIKRTTDVLCGLSRAGEVREFWMYVSDSDSDSDYDDTNNGRVKRSVRCGGIRVVNPSPHGNNDSKTILGGAHMIYPGPDHQHYTYRHDHVRDFSRKAINQYNHQTVCMLLYIKFKIIAYIF